ncbi:enoyl-CoA hydratase/isomerase family protein [uncultured Erythrobacter sp.]|uniref:enoyl-CoA hydratase/isomerase family protein n=1 Tax=uncultured Erythrobacter sp. TaxID=263913 RepID=UPI00265B2389|nr:enoyl-CoA hydratase/isomerase family protein [uncultured Erythrobacter sp.]
MSNQLIEDVASSDVEATSTSPDFQTIRLDRHANGVLLVTLHDGDGGPFKITDVSHRELGEAFAAIGADRANKVVILTGAANAFIDGAAFSDPAALTTPGGVRRLAQEGTRLIRNFLDIEVPVIAAVIGVANVHADLAFASDIVIASHNAVFQDVAHIAGGLPPSDGAHVIWLEALGHLAGKRYLVTAEPLAASEAIRLGGVNEVLASDAVLPRAIELADQLAALPELTRRYSRVLLTQRLKARLQEDLGWGFALESVAALAIGAER